jgi:hypothetical protein
LRQVCLAAPALQPCVGTLQQLLGLGAAYADPHVATWGLCNAVLPVGRQFIEWVAPTTADAPLQRFLARHPAGAGYIVILNDEALDARRAHLLAQGVRLVSDLGIEGFHTLQVHPRDAGACMLEFNHTQGGQAWDGPYAPAGPHWQQAVRTEHALGLAGVRLRVADPHAVAALWARLMGVAVDHDAAGRPRLAVDGGQLLWEPSTEGQSEGLVGIDLQVLDVAAVLARASALGLPVDTHRAGFELGGVMWGLTSPAKPPA